MKRALFNGLSVVAGATLLMTGTIGTVAATPGIPPATPDQFWSQMTVIGNQMNAITSSKPYTIMNDFTYRVNFNADGDIPTGRSNQVTLYADGSMTADQWETSVLPNGKKYTYQRAVKCVASGRCWDKVNQGRGNDLKWHALPSNPVRIVDRVYSAATITGFNKPADATGEGYEVYNERASYSWVRNQKDLPYADTSLDCTEDTSSTYPVWGCLTDVYDSSTIDNLEVLSESASVSAVAPMKVKAPKKSELGKPHKNNPSLVVEKPVVAR